MKKVQFKALRKLFIKPEIFKKRVGLRKVRSFPEISEDVQKYIRKDYSDKEINDLVEKVRIELWTKEQKRSSEENFYIF